MNKKNFITLLLALFFFLNIRAFAQEIILSPEQMQKDISYMEAVFKNIHPGFYRYNTEEQLESYLSELKDKCSKPLTEKTFFVLLSKFTAKIKCGHTFLSPYNANEKVAARIFPDKFFPFYFKIIDDKIIVTHNLSENDRIKRGDEIISINGYASKGIIDSLLFVSRTDGNNGLAKQYDNLNLTPQTSDGKALFDIFFPLFFPLTSNEYSVSVKTSDGNSINTKVNSLLLKERNELFVNGFGEIPSYESTWKFSELDSGIAYLKMGTFAFWDRAFDSTYKFYLDSIFKVINDKKISNLILDIRGNEGGSDDIRDYVLSYVMLKPYGCDNPARRFYKYISIADSLLPYLNTWDESFKKPKSPDLYKMNELGFYEKNSVNAPCEPKNPQINNYKGNVYLLTDASNSSASFTMADVLKSNGRAVLIGEPTGGNAQGINGGQFFFFSLPNSKFEIDIPLVFGYKGEDKKDGGIEPDHNIKTFQNDIVTGRDAQMEFTLGLIKTIRNYKR